MRCQILGVVTDRLYRCNAECAKRIRAVILPDDVSVDGSSDEWMESDGGYVQQRGGDSELAEDAISDDYCYNEMDGTDSCFHW